MEEKLKWHRSQITANGEPYEKAIAGDFIFYLWAESVESILYNLTVSSDLIFTDESKSDTIREFRGRPYDSLKAKAEEIAKALELV